MHTLELVIGFMPLLCKLKGKVLVALLSFVIEKTKKKGGWDRKRVNMQNDLLYLAGLL